MTDKTKYIVSRFLWAILIAVLASGAVYNFIAAWWM